MARVALFGGSFNPPHVAHQLVALYVVETYAVDELWFVPTYSHPFGKHLASFDDRVAMCERASVVFGDRVRVSRAEEELAQRPDFVSSRTIDLIDHVIAMGHAPRLVIGADILGETAKWHRWDDIVARARPIVLGRSGYPVPPGAEASGIVMPSVSSTHVRELIANGDPERANDARRLLPASVVGYIADHGLYR